MDRETEERELKKLRDLMGELLEENRQAGLPDDSPDMNYYRILVSCVEDIYAALNGLLFYEIDPQTGKAILRRRKKPPRRRSRSLPCGARTRKGTPCRMMREPGRSRCRLHGGLSTGPRTPEGKARIAESNRRRARENQVRKA